MSRRKEQIITCDVCKQSVTDGGEQHFGGHPFSGWLHLSVHGGSTALEALRAQREFDFCSNKCAIKYLRGKEGR